MHKGQPFKCTNCDYASSRKQNLKKHIAAVHEGLKKSRKIVNKSSNSANQIGTLPKHAQNLAKMESNCPKPQISSKISTTNQSESEKRLDETESSDSDVPNETPKMILYPCKICKKDFAGPKTLQIHERYCREKDDITEDSVGPLKDILSSLKSRKLSYVESEKSEASEKSADEVEWDCQYCGDSFNTTRSLKIHEKMMHSNSSSKVSRTNSNSSNNSDQNQHKSDQEIVLEIKLEKMFEMSDETNFDDKTNSKLDGISKIDDYLNPILEDRQEMDKEMDQEKDQEKNQEKGQEKDQEMNQEKDQIMDQEMDQEPQICQSKIEIVEEASVIKDFFSELIKNELAKGIIDFDLDLNEFRNISLQPNVVLSKSDCIDALAIRIQKPKQNVIKPTDMAEKGNTGVPRIVRILGSQGIVLSRKSQDILNESLAISTAESHKSSNYSSTCGAMFKNSAVHDEKNKKKLYHCTKCGERFTWASDYLRHNRIVHIQTKINSLYAMLGLEAVKWS